MKVDRSCRAAEKKAVETAQEEAMKEAEEQPSASAADPPPVAQVSTHYCCLPSHFCLPNPMGST